jgi:ferric-dicitrate binding protein FerR (iron transport regulator)
MNCDRATHLLNARIDGELAGDDALALDAHLAACAGCRQALMELELQDAALLRTFNPQNAVAAAIADRVLAELPDVAEPAATRSTIQQPNWPRTVAWAMAACIGLIAATVAFRLLHRTDLPQPPSQVPQPIAQLTFATGNVFVCPSGEDTWRPMVTGDSIAAGDKVRTADSAKCELQLIGGARVRLDCGTKACLTDAATVQVDAGQLWSAIPQNAVKPLRVLAGNSATITAHPALHEARPTQLEVACSTGSASIMVKRGGADVCTTGETKATTRLKGGDILCLPPQPPINFIERMTAADALFARPWQDDLLVLKPGDDLDVAERVGELLERIGFERIAASIGSTRPAATIPGPAEQDVRGRGQAWSTPFVCYVRGKSPVERESRRTAARLLADLAPASCIPDLIELLADEDTEVRGSVGIALRRLTGQDFGQASALCAESVNPAVVAMWRAWWKENKQRYGVAR